MHCLALQSQSRTSHCCGGSFAKAPTIPRSLRSAAISSSLSSSSTTTTTTTTKPLPLFGVADSSHLLPRRDVLIVHEKRSAPPGTSIPRERVREIVKESVKTTISLDDPTAAADALASAVAASHPELARTIRGDVLLAASALAPCLPRGETRSLSAKLEVITKQSCPKWHSDYVGCRCLVTYAGPGTLFAPPAAVSLSRSSGGGGVGGGGGGGSVIDVDERAAVQVEPFDFLFLKGRVSAAASSPAWTLPSPTPLRELAASLFSQNNQHPQQHQQQPPLPPRRSVLALGAVHKSPADASEEFPRLVLTVDDSCECCPS